MPGERLMCVWQAAYLRDPATSGQPKKDTIQLLCESFKASSAVNFDKATFNNTFKESTIEFKKFKDYVFDHLKNKGTPMYSIEEEVEALCWKICKPYYQLENTFCTEQSAFHLWQVFNKLVVQSEQPPKIRLEEAEWLTDRIVGPLGKSVSSKAVEELKGGASYGQYLKFLDTKYFHELNAGQLENCIDEVHQWLVKEVLMTGYLQKRTRKQANWTNVQKRWFVLTPGKLSYFEKPNKELKGEVLVTVHSKLESIPDFKKSFRTMKSVFKITNEPYYEIEMSASDEKEKRAWITAVRDVIEAARAGTTPVQALLRDKFSKSASIQGSMKDVETRVQSIRLKAESANPAQVKAQAKAAINSQKPKPNSPQKLKPVREKSTDEGSEEEAPDTFDNNFVAYQNNKMKTVFSNFDTDGNGLIDAEEFEKFIAGLGVNMNKEEIALVFKTVDKNGNGQLSLDEFSEYFLDFIVNETGKNCQVEANLRSAFLKADSDGTGTVDFKEFVEFAWERKRSVRVSRLLKTFQSMDDEKSGEVSFGQFRNFLQKQRMSILEGITEADEESDSMPASLEGKLKQLYDSTDTDELADYLRSRWKNFVSFKRYGASGDLVMEGASGFVADILPGEYNLVDLACFNDLPPLEPKRAILKGVRWIKSDIPGKSGQLLFPDDFDGIIPTDYATNEHLRYYGASLADQNQVKVALLYRHAIQDFTYQNQYLGDYVKNPDALGGSGIERHMFSHLDCPLNDDSGTFIMAKFVDEAETELHLTGFKVPTRHTLYIPSNVIHSNDYLKGTWRTMLSDEAAIDHVQLYRRTDNECRHFEFTFA